MVDMAVTIGTPKTRRSWGGATTQYVAVGAVEVGELLVFLVHSGSPVNPNPFCISAWLVDGWLNPIAPLSKIAAAEASGAYHGTGVWEITLASSYSWVGVMGLASVALGHDAHLAAFLASGFDTSIHWGASAYQLGTLYPSTPINLSIEPESTDGIVFALGSIYDGGNGPLISGTSLSEYYNLIPDPPSAYGCKCRNTSQDISNLTAVSSSFYSDPAYTSGIQALMLELRGTPKETFLPFGNIL